ncbi:MAG: GntR family transcriptional regulator [Clostridia bacterium]|nr:GntR family transcriptional regulator [Clostridia bacterium]
MSDTSFLYKKITKYLAELISENLNNKDYYLPTEAEISARYKVSRITVRKAFDELNKNNILTRIKGRGTFISEGVTKEDLVEYLGIGSGRNKKIAVILPLLDGSQHIISILSAIIREAYDMNVFVSVSDMSVEKEQKIINEYISIGVDGIIVYPIDNDIYNNTLISLATSDYPLVLVDRSLPGLNFACVSSDHRGMMASAMKFLLKKNNRHILFFNSNTKTNSALAARQECYVNTLSQHNIYNQYYFSFNGDLDPTSESFAEKFSEYIKNNPEITAIVTADYASGMHLIQIMNILKMNYSEIFDTVFLDFTDQPDIFHSTVNMSAYVQQDSQKIGTEAVKLLRKAIDKQPLTKSKTISIPTEFVETTIL